MTKIQQVNGPSLTDLQKRLCTENLRRLKAFAETPPEERPAPTPRELTCDHKPVPLAISLLDLTNTNTVAAGELPPPKDDQHHAIPGNTLRLTERKAHRFNRIG